MTPMAPTRPNRPASPAARRPAPALPGAEPPAGHPRCCVPLLADLAAARPARAVVEDIIRAWRVPVDTDTAVLLASELVTNAVTHGVVIHDAGTPGTCVLLTITRDDDCLRVDVHDGSGDLPVLDEAAAESETGRGLLLVTSLSAEWGFYRTSVGKAVYFTLNFPRLDSPATGGTGRPG